MRKQGATPTPVVEAEESLALPYEETSHAVDEPRPDTQRSHTLDLAPSGVRKMRSLGVSKMGSFETMGLPYRLPQ